MVPSIVCAFVVAIILGVFGPSTLKADELAQAEQTQTAMPMVEKEEVKTSNVIGDDGDEERDETVDPDEEKINIDDENHAFQLDDEEDEDFN